MVQTWYLLLAYDVDLNGFRKHTCHYFVKFLVMTRGLAKNNKLVFLVVYWLEFTHFKCEKIGYLEFEP